LPIQKSFFMPDTLHPAPNDPAFHKLPPQSIEAEESILSAILIDNSTLIDILEILNADDFTKPPTKPFSPPSRPFMPKANRWIW
jgi:hypothetical protein